MQLHFLRKSNMGQTNVTRFFNSRAPASWGGGGGGGGVLPYKRLMGMCRWMGLHFHNWIG